MRGGQYNYQRAAASQLGGGEEPKYPRGDTRRGRKGRCHDRHRFSHLCAREAGHERVRAQDGVVYHTYSTFARGLDGLWGAFQWLDRAPKGRNERGNWGIATTSTTSGEPNVGLATGEQEICKSTGWAGG